MPFSSPKGEERRETTISIFSGVSVSIKVTKLGIRFPLRRIRVVNNGIIATGPASTAGGVATTFTIPQDTDNIVVKFTASILAGGVSATLQTTDDGGTTYYDVARTSIISNANGVTAEWLSTPVIGVGVKTAVVAPSVVATGSVQSFGSVYGSIGRAGASTLAQGAVSGLPILSTQGRIFLQYTSAVTSIIAEVVDVYVNSESGTA